MSSALDAFAAKAGVVSVALVTSRCTASTRPLALLALATLVSVGLRIDAQSSTDGVTSWTLSGVLACKGVTTERLCAALSRSEQMALALKAFKGMGLSSTAKADVFFKLTEAFHHTTVDVLTMEK